MITSGLQMRVAALLVPLLLLAFAARADTLTFAITLRQILTRAFRPAHAASPARAKAQTPQGSIATEVSASLRHTVELKRPCG
jgi:hypothetical protein